LIVKVANNELKFDDTDPETTIRAYGLDINKKIVMLIRLYFPKVSTTHQKFFAANREINKLLFALNNGETVEENIIQTTYETYLHLLRVLEEEVIHNKNVLIKANLLPRIYKKSA